MDRHAQNPVVIPAFHQAGASLESATRVYVDAVDTVRELPETTEGVAHFLADIGVTGVMSSGNQCVLVRFLRDSVQPEDGIYLAVMGDALHVSFDAAELVYNLPYHVARFVKQFDSGFYPALEVSEG